MNSLKIKSILTVIITTSFLLLSSLSFAANNGDSNQIDFALISDPHVDIHKYKPVNINPQGSSKGSNLDKPSFITLISKFSNELSQLPENPSFILALGDIPSHNAGKRRAEFLKVAFQTFYEKFYPMPLFYSFGNNDSVQRNYGLFKYNGNSAYEISKNVTGKGGFLSSGEICPFTNKPCVINKNETYGYYSAYIGDHLKLISLNSIIFVHRPGFSPSREGDKEQMEWFRNEIKKSQMNKEQVILVMHAAPSSWAKEYKPTLKSIINAHPQVIIGIFAGHSHHDELRAIHSNSQIIPIIFGAGLSTDHGNSSSFKTVSISRETNQKPWDIQNYVTYYFKGNKAENSYVEKYYDFKSEFCPSRNTSFSTCLKSHIKKSGTRYKFSEKASKLLKEHCYANPQIPGNRNTSNWVINY